MIFEFLAAAQSATPDVATASLPAIEGVPVLTTPADEPLDFSLLALFLRATLTVQIVMVVLIVASVWSWAIIVEKYFRFGRARKDSAMFEDAFWSGQPLEELYDRVAKKPRSAHERIFVAGMNEWRRSYRKGALIQGSQARIDRSMNVTIARESEGINSGLGVLATVGSTSPFIGLFGTVWGIKHSFEQIAMTQNTNLAVVAPGIAEALVATALGLLAAIPAVIFYNKLSGDADRITTDFENFADEFSTILSRQIERGAE
jgi:biopolymer transport protein TolQ